MAKNKDKRKYNPQKAVDALKRLSQSSTFNVAAIVLSKTSTMTRNNVDGLLLPADRQQTILISAQMSLRTLQECWCVHSFRAMTHWSRVLENIGRSLRRPSSVKAARLGMDALVELSNTDEENPICGDDTSNRLNIMIAELGQALQFTPTRTYMTAETSSRTIFSIALGRDWHSRDQRIRTVLPQILRGSSLRDVTPDGISGHTMRDQVKQMGWILHGLMPHSNAHQMPQTLSELRRLSKNLLPVIEKLESGWLLGETADVARKEARATMAEMGEKFEIAA